MDIGGREEGKEMKTVENSRERKSESLRTVTMGVDESS